MKRTALLLALALALPALAGCGGVREHIRKHNTPPEVLDPVAAYLEPKVGVLSYDDALVQWGHPKFVTDGDSIFLATWTVEEAHAVGGTFERMFASERGGNSLNATFDLETRTLQSFGFSQK
jgi:hypothetical protein